MADFKSIIDQHHPIIYKICRVYATKADFEDLYQEVLISLWKSQDNFEGKSKLSTWIYKVALNTAISYHKHSKRKGWTSWLGLSPFLKSEDIAAEDHIDRKNDLDQLYWAIRQLRKEERSIILLYLEEYKQIEIADIVGITENNVAVKINRIKKKLKTLISQ